MKDVRVSQDYPVRVNHYAIVLVLEGKNKGKEFFLTADTMFSGEQRLLICGSRC